LISVLGPDGGPLLPVALGAGRAQGVHELVGDGAVGVGVLFGVSFLRGHRKLLQTVMLARHGKKDAMSLKELDFKNFHQPHLAPLTEARKSRVTVIINF
jgi:hypothetical protein